MEGRTTVVIAHRLSTGQSHLALQCTRRDQLRAAARAVQCVPAARVIAFDSGASRGLTADMPLRNQTHATACAVQSVPGARTVCTRRALAGT
eukprot:177970-Rhodomonas_salina.3